MRTMPWLRSVRSTIRRGSTGWVKLGQPLPLSYLWTEANNGSPLTTST